MTEPQSVKALLHELQATGESLRIEVPTLLLSQSPEELTEEMIRRDEKRNDCQRLYNAIKDQVMTLDSMCRQLRNIKADLAHDNKKLEARKWDLIAERRHSK